MQIVGNIAEEKYQFQQNLPRALLFLGWGIVNLNRLEKHLLELKTHAATQ